MKGILVIDFPNDVDVTDLRMVYIIGDSDGLVVKVQSTLLPCLKPIPSKRETVVHWKNIGGIDILTHEPSEYNKGWNDCVDFLEGDEND